jgi:large subunit ribosomal protein L29
MKSNELREISEKELVDHIRTARREIFGLRFQHATGELENTAGMGKSKKDLARALTIARQRGINTENL